MCFIFTIYALFFVPVWSRSWAFTSFKIFVIKFPSFTIINRADAIAGLRVKVLVFRAIHTSLIHYIPNLFISASNTRFY